MSSMEGRRPIVSPLFSKITTQNKLWQAPNDDTLTRLKNATYQTSLPGFAEHKLDEGLLSSLKSDRKSSLLRNLQMQVVLKQKQLRKD